MNEATDEGAPMSMVSLADHPVLATPLDGISLIEASAGTGKTWTIVGLYLRLLLERAVPPRSILVVTFTNAATAELKERIRGQLHALRDALAGAPARSSPTDPLIDALVERVGPAGHSEALARIRLAVESLDEAAIHTIHGFCQRLLAEHAFASGSPFESEVRATQTRVVNDVARDFWRQALGKASNFEASVLAAQGRDPVALVAAARLALGARIEILQPDPVDLAHLGERLARAYHDAARAWTGARDRIEAMLMAGVLSRTKYPPNSVPRWCDAVEQYLGEEGVPLDGPDHLDHFGATFIAGAINKGKAPPHHPFFAAADVLLGVLAELKQASAAHWYRMAARFAIEGSAEIARRKRVEGWQSYDDLLLRVHEALSSARGKEFAHAVAARYTVALIDEFQDTDDVQYAILRRLFQETGSTTVLVGDPKQAIYGFRGADVFAYLRARGVASNRFDLTVNRRSTRQLLEVINAVCGRGAGRFLLPEIAFQPAQSPHGSATALVNDDLPPFVLWFVPGAPGDPAHKGASRARIAQAVAAEVARLLGAGEARRTSIEEGGERRSLNGRDIAILVGRHGEADLMRDALADYQIASVTFGDRSIFRTPEAEDFAQVLAALANPDDERLIRGALATPLFGMTLTDLARLAEAPLQWESFQQRFHDYRTLVDTANLIRMFREIVATTDLVARMLGRAGGDRALSNYQQLAELLHEAQRAEDLDAMGIARFLQRAMSADEPADDEQQLRLETDEALVRIMTIHRAKGLEFPVVFCPFLWDGQMRKTDPVPVRFHDADHDNAAIIDFGSSDIEAHRALAETEALAERIRVAYVALTRAKLRCYVVWGAMKECAASALAWLLHGPVDLAADPSAARKVLVDRLKGLSSSAFRDEVNAVAERGGEGIAVIELPAPPSVGSAGVPIERSLGRAIAFSGTPPLPRRFSSFSALVANVDLDLPDHDGFIAAAVIDEREPEDDILAFPRGAKAGSCLHAVLERAMIEDAPAAGAFSSIATQALDEFGLSRRLEATVVRIIEHVLTTSLDGRPEFFLGAIPVARRVIEMEFWYPIANERSATLERIIASHRTACGLPRLAGGAIQRGLAKGYMKGFIDLVFEHDGRFYIADYKSNWLGATVGEYGESALAANVAGECYDLQYLLYTLAIDRYLGTRIADYDYQQHFGGVIYLYLRGLRRDRGAGSGVYFSRPALAVIEALRSLATAAA